MKTRQQHALSFCDDSQPRCRGSVLIIVLVTMLFAVAALTLFIEKASTDLIVATRDATDTRLRAEAYSALETTVAGGF
jgi:general secretion pathway protein K